MNWPKKSGVFNLQGFDSRLCLALAAAVQRIDAGKKTIQLMLEPPLFQMLDGRVLTILFDFDDQSIAAEKHCLLRNLLNGGRR